MRGCHRHFVHFPESLQVSSSTEPPKGDASHDLSHVQDALSMWPSETLHGPGSLEAESSDSSALISHLSGTDGNHLKKLSRSGLTVAERAKGLLPGAPTSITQLQAAAIVRSRWGGSANSLLCLLSYASYNPWTPCSLEHDSGNDGGRWGAPPCSQLRPQ